VLESSIGFAASSGPVTASCAGGGSSPADGSQVTAAPTELVLSFSEAAQLTALAIARAGGATQKLTAPAASQARIRVPLPALAAGDYVVSWRALGADGHLVPGQIRFTITR
jgi:methionine-rich copper-binding protein CopC